MKYLLAHDIGTSGDKAALFSADGHLIASKTVSYQTFYAQGGAIEQRPQDWWEAVCQATRAVMAGVDPAQIAAVCFGGMGHCCTCLDEQGNFLAPSLLWSDSRSGQEQAELEAAFGAKKCYEVTGHKCSTAYTITKLMWIKKHWPEVYQKTHKVLTAKDVIVYRLTGRMCTDYSDACGYMAYDYKKMAWAPEIIAAAGLRQELFPEIVSGREVAGYVTRQAAAETGLAEGTPVVPGGMDGGVAHQPPVVLCQPCHRGAVQLRRQQNALFTGKDLRQCVVKIDAPAWESSRLSDLGELTDQYVEWLHRLSGLPVGAFLNHPLEIAEVLDKRRCKEKLIQNNVPVTQMYPQRFSCGEELISYLKEHRIGQVFVKPVRGSGAAGVAALRFSPGNGRMALYTCAASEQDVLFNTKRMYRLEGKKAADFLDRLLKLDCVVERWHGKASWQGYCYDLRVILQAGRVDYIFPRLSKGPITNLHLNNHSVEFEELHLERKTTERIKEVCLRAAECYPGLGSMGMDVLLEQGSLEPRIIEINAQGDLLHRDVYGENRIYKRQIDIIEKMLHDLPQ